MTVKGESVEYSTTVLCIGSDTCSQSTFYCTWVSLYNTSSNDTMTACDFYFEDEQQDISINDRYAAVRGTIVDVSCVDTSEVVFELNGVYPPDGISSSGGYSCSEVSVLCYEDSIGDDSVYNGECIMEYTIKDLPVFLQLYSSYSSINVTNSTSVMESTMETTMDSVEDMSEWMTSTEFPSCHPNCPPRRLLQSVEFTIADFITWECTGLVFLCFCCQMYLVCVFLVQGDS